MPRMSFARAVERLKEIDLAETRGSWEMGDIALEMVPMGADHARNGAGEKVRVLAEAAGITYDALRIRRDVSHAFPDPTRVGSVSWSVYRELLNVKQEKRDELVALLKSDEKPDTPSGRWTVSAMRVRMGLGAILHVSEPVSEHVQRASTRS